MAALCLHFQVNQSRRCLRKLPLLTPLPTGSSTYTTLSGGTHTETHSETSVQSLPGSVRMGYTGVPCAHQMCMRSLPISSDNQLGLDHLLHICMRVPHQIQCRQPRPYPLLNVWPECRATDLQVTCVWLSFPRKHRTTALQSAQAQASRCMLVQARTVSGGRVRVSADPVFKAFRLNRGDLASLQRPIRS
jgi:hypothetical protein